MLFSKRLNYLRIGVGSFLIAVAVALLFGASLSREQTNLSSKLIRLHVVASSDSREDQALKLRVRDAVLETLSAPLAQANSVRAAAEIINGDLESARAAALREIRAAGYDYNVTAAVTSEAFPTREYDTFTLPAGDYTALRVVIGEGGGQNWWCVVFPPLCAPDGVTYELDGEYGASILLDDDEIKLITDKDGYVIRFKCLELLAKLRELISG
ncbi:MAG: stage II sporulation protein R [Oscillospiraceae bacterium]|nr:stage II sporulation protein R [Oscillospiraceae bacterium]